MLAVLLLALSAPQEAYGQWVTRWLSVGRLHHPYLSGGAEPEGQPFATAGWQWPGVQPETGHSRWKGVWVSVPNFTDENGREYPVRNSHIGPRVLGIGEFFDQKHELVSKYPDPEVIVDGLRTFNRPTTVDRVDESIAPDRLINSVTNTSVGVQMRRRPMQWSTRSHDSYHLIEYTFTNTGNTDDDPEIELPDQTLEDVYFMLFDRPTANVAAGTGQNSAGGVSWGQYTMNDAVGDGNEDYKVDFRAQYSWLGYVPDKQLFNTLGNPMWYNTGANPVPDDTLGRLGAAQMAGTVVVHADGRAHAPEETSVADDPGQPSTMTYLSSDWSEIAASNSHNNIPRMEFERRWIERGSQGDQLAPPSSDGRVYPHHADIVEPDGNFATTTGDPSRGEVGGYGYANGYGPYTLEPGEQVRIVVADAIAGLSDSASYVIGRRYRRSGAQDSMKIPFDADLDGMVEDDERLTKNRWALTARDSLFQLFQRAIANYESGYAVPHPPPPPSRFEVASGTDEISISWENTFGPDPPGGWELWRAQKAYYGIITALRVENGMAVPDSARAYEKVASLDGSAREYLDQDVERGLSYFYYLQAVGEENMDPTGNTPTGQVLKSSRYYTQTYEPAFLKRAPGTALSDTRVVPNPYNLGASTDVRFGDVQDKIAFYGLPAQARIRIFTETGEHVKTIEHTDGSGDEFWNLTTSSRQIVSSGIYLAVIQNRETGEQIVRKIIIIR